MKVKQKRLEVFTAPIDKLLTWLCFLEGEDYFLRGGWDRLLRDGEIKEVRLIHNDEVLPDTAKTWLDEVGYDPTDDDEIEFTICSPEVRPVELTELRAKQEAAMLAEYAKARRSEISYTEAYELAKKVRHNSDFQVFYIETDHILTFHLGRLPRVGEKITKVELTNDGVEFTMVRV